MVDNEEELLNELLEEGNSEPEEQEHQDFESEEEHGSSDDDFDPEVDTLLRQKKEAAQYKRKYYKALSQLKNSQTELENYREDYSSAYLQNLKLQNERIERELVEAKAAVAFAEPEDRIKVAEAQGRLAEVTAAKLQFEREAYPQISQLEDWQQRSNEYYDYVQNQPQQPSLGEHQQQALADWLEMNEDINPRSPRMVPEINQAVIQYATHLDNELYNSNQIHMIGSPEYQDALDQYAARCRSQYYTPSSSRPSVASSGGALPVRGRSSGGRGTSVKMSKAELDFCDQNNLNVEEYVKYRETR